MIPNYIGITTSIFIKNRLSVIIPTSEDSSKVNPRLYEGIGCESFHPHGGLELGSSIPCV